MPALDASHDRFVSFEGVYNFRDFGGIHTRDARELRRRHLFRSDAMHRATHEDMTTLLALNIHSNLDLRPPSEIAFTGRGLLEDSPVKLITSPLPSVLSATMEDSQTVLWRRYLEYLETPTFLTLLRELIDHLESPCVINCFFGKDRTGVFSALILELLGVGRSDIIFDYALSASRMESLCDALRADVLYAEVLEQTDPERLSATAETMSTFLHAADERYGGLEAWARSHGLSELEITRLRNRLLTA